MTFWIAIFSFLFGLLSFYVLFKIKLGGFERLSREILHKSEMQTKTQSLELELSLKEEKIEHERYLAQLTRKTEEKLSKEKECLEKKEDEFDKKWALVEKKLSEIEQTSQRLSLEQTAFKNKQAAFRSQLEKLSKLTTDEAKNLLLENVANEQQAAIGDLITRMKNEGEKEAIRLLTRAINRLCVKTVSQVAVTSVSLPNKEMKRRIIGREGRNIRALEQAIGVNFVIDDTPNSVVISGYDPIRKEIAKQVLHELIKDGRIHPTRIENVTFEVQENFNQQIKDFGERAAAQAKVFTLHPELILLLGKLHFHYSLGQNLLDHSLEVSFLMEILASELGLDSELAKRIGLLHDIGQALSHQTKGSHALIGSEIALKYREKEEIANGIGCHHDEIPPITIEACLCSTADKISAERPGARNEALEQYIKRSHKLERLACQYEGVEKAYAFHAGREIRVIVKPDFFDDASMACLGRNLAKKIEKELSYPGKIKITVIREKRAIEYAN
ncbi:MAG: ribonuclease Y [Chlamydiales bacterium]